MKAPATKIRVSSRAARAACLMAALAWAVGVATSASAEPKAMPDTSAMGATIDGDASEFTATSAGINNGFNNVIGSATTFGVETDVFGNLAFGLTGSVAAACSNDVIVIYLDSVPGGFTTTSGFTDNADAHRAALSAVGTGASGRADLTFAADFEPDFAIAVNPVFAGLWQLKAGGSHVFVKALTATPETAWTDSCNHELSGLTLADLGAEVGDTFTFIVTLVNPADGGGAYRSDEFHGVASTTVSGNPGINPLTLAAGDFNTFKSVRVLINELDADTPGSDAAEFVELYDDGVGGVDLTGLVVVFFNGSGDTSYLVDTHPSIDLDARTTSTEGFFLIANPGVTGVDFVINPGTQGAIQNGADAVALYLDAASRFPNSSVVSATNLVDALVYDTSDADDTGLLNTLTPGQPQIDENGMASSSTVSSQRCGGGGRVTDAYALAAPTPKTVNACPVCGNSLIEFGETCDDGNNDAGDGCSPTCIIECGNGTVDSGEACDDGNTTDGDGCDSNCTATACGNGIVTSGEVCDDGNTTNGDGCSGTCTVETNLCGNGTVDTGEACDDSNTTDGDGCDSNCTVTACGNGIVTNTESCDDGNATDGDGCDSNCTATACGNGVVTTGEACDDGNTDNTDACVASCVAATCGDGYVRAGVEQCDDGNTTDGDGCSATCTGEAGACGNGTVDTGEACDDGNSDDTDACLSTCLDATCGDGYVQTGVEACDDGTANSDTVADACRTTCEAAGCGDGVIDTGEECDEGSSNADTGTCSTTCMVVTGEDVADTDDVADPGSDVADDGPDVADSDSDVAADTTTGADTIVHVPDTTSDLGGSDVAEGAKKGDDGCGCVSVRAQGRSSHSLIAMLMAVGLGLVVWRRRRG